MKFKLASLAFLNQLFASPDFALIVFGRLALCQAMEEGLRMPITEQTLGGMGKDTTVRRVVKRNSWVPKSPVYQGREKQ